MRHCSIPADLTCGTEKILTADRPMPSRTPIYVVLTGSSASLPLYVEDVFAVTRNFEFACCLCARLTDCSRVMRVTRYNNWLCVKPQAIPNIRHLETLCDQRSFQLDQGAVRDSEVPRTRCLICIKVDGMWSKKEIVGVTASADLPPQHVARCYPYHLNEWLNFDSLNPFRPSLTATDKAVLQCARMDWAGQLFFAKAVKSRLPTEIIWLIQEVCLANCLSGRDNTI